MIKRRKIVQYNTQEILDILNHTELNAAFDFLTEETEEESEDMFNLWADIDRFNFFEYYNQGATKMVLTPYEGDYVIKIPFTGRILSNSRIQSFHCARGRKNHWDYCAVEVERYQQIKQANLTKFFVETKYLGSVKGYPIYIQQQCYTSNKAKISSVDSISQVKKVCNSLHFTPSCSFDWLGAVLEKNGAKEVLKLTKFFKKVKWGDLHNGNIGFLKDQPVIFDYGDYNEF